MNKINELDYNCTNLDIFSLTHNGFKFNGCEKIKVEINIDKEDILETIDMNSIVHLKNEFPVFLKQIEEIKKTDILPLTDAINNEVKDSVLPPLVPTPTVQVSVSNFNSTQSESDKENTDLIKYIQSQPGPVVSCYMVPETLYYFARKQGYNFEFVQTRKRKRTLPYAETDWFYTANIDNVLVKPANSLNGRRHKVNLTECKALLVKAHHLKAIKMQTARSSQNMFDVEYIADFKVLQVFCIYQFMLFSPKPNYLFTKLYL